MAFETGNINDVTTNVPSKSLNGLIDAAYEIHGMLMQLKSEKGEIAHISAKLYSGLISPLEELSVETRGQESDSSGLEELSYQEWTAPQDATSLNAELITKGEEDFECWIEVAKGMRVRTAIPARSFRGLELNEGDEFLWSPTKHVAKIKPSEGDSAEYQQLRNEFLELQREFHEELKDLDIGLNDE